MLLLHDFTILIILIPSPLKRECAKHSIMSTGLPHYDGIFGVHRKRLSYKGNCDIMKLFKLEQ